MLIRYDYIFIEFYEMAQSHIGQAIEETDPEFLSEVEVETRRGKIRSYKMKNKNDELSSDDDSPRRGSQRNYPVPPSLGNIQLFI